MTTRARMHVAMLVGALLALAYSRVAVGWSDATFYAGLAALITVVGFMAMPWIELARDGAFRRPRARSG